MLLSLGKNLFILLCSLSLESPGGLRFETGGADRAMDALMARGSADFLDRF